MDLLDWIDIENLNWDYLSQNPNAIELLEANPDNIQWSQLSKNNCYLLDDGITSYSYGNNKINELKNQ